MGVGVAVRDPRECPVPPRQVRTRRPGLPHAGQGGAQIAPGQLAVQVGSESPVPLPMAVIAATASDRVATFTTRRPAGT